MKRGQWPAVWNGGISHQGFFVTIERGRGGAPGLQLAGVGPAMTSPRDRARPRARTYGRERGRAIHHGVTGVVSDDAHTVFSPVPNPLLSRLSLPRVRPLSSRILLEGRAAWVFSRAGLVLRRVCEVRRPALARGAVTRDNNPPNGTELPSPASARGDSRLAILFAHRGSLAVFLTSREPPIRAHRARF